MNSYQETGVYCLVFNIFTNKQTCGLQIPSKWSGKSINNLYLSDDENEEGESKDDLKNEGQMEFENTSKQSVAAAIKEDSDDMEARKIQASTSYKRRKSETPNDASGEKAKRGKKSNVKEDELTTGVQAAELISQLETFLNM